MTAFELAWYGCDLRTGAVIEELPAVTTGQPLERRLSASSTVNVDLTIAGAPPAWPYATEPGHTMLVAADRTYGNLLWAGIVLTRDRGTEATASLGMVTAEAYLDRRFTGDYAAVGVDQASIMAAVAAPALVNGPPIIIDAPAVGITGTYSVLDGDDRTVLSALQELQQQDGWPEWTIDLQWADTAKTTVQLVLRIRPQVGVVRADPDVTFDLPGCITKATQSQSYESGKGATTITAYGVGEGSSRLHSSTYTASDLLTQGWPRWDYRYTPAAAASDPNALNAQASKALTQMRTGSTAWAIEAAASAAPRLGRDWALGDSIAIQIDPNTIPGRPDGASVVARAYAWQLDPTTDTVTPILVEDN